MQLRNYQTEAHKNIRTWLAAGERDLLLEMPVGSGKTFTVTHLAAELLAAGTLRAVVVLVPQNLLKDTWGKDGARVLKSARGLDWEQAKGLIIVTRQAVTARDFDIDSLRNGSLRGMLVVADEGHHCAKSTAGGKVLAALRTKGAATLLVSATPWATAGDITGPETKVHRLSDAEYVASFKAGDRSAPPSLFGVHQVLVGAAVTDPDATIDRSGAKRGTSKPGDADEMKRAMKFCAAMAERWRADGFPRAVMNVPRTFWREPLTKALAKVWRASNGGAPVLLDLVGDLDKEALATAQERLRVDSKAPRIADVQINVVMSCARMDEGVDWVPCSHVYNVGIPESARLILQRWGRAARAKGSIKGYPAAAAHERALVFFTPPGRGQDEGWDRQREVAFLLAAYTADYEMALEWTKTRAARSLPATPPLASRTQEVAEWSGKLAEQVERKGGTMEPVAAVEWLTRKGCPEPVAQTAVRRMLAQSPANRAIMEKAEIGGLALKDERRAEAEPLLSEFVDPLMSMMDRALKFTAQNAGDMRVRMSIRSRTPWTDMNLQELQSFARDTAAKLGFRPSKASMHGGVSWGGLDAALVRYGSSLAKTLGGIGATVIKDFEDFFMEHGRNPNRRIPSEAKLARRVQTARENGLLPKANRGRAKPAAAG